MEKWQASSGTLAGGSGTGKLFRAQGSSGAHMISLLWGLSFFAKDHFTLNLLLSG